MISCQSGSVPSYRGGAATRPTLEFSRINRIAHVYVNGVKLARREGPEEDFTVDLCKVVLTAESDGLKPCAITLKSK
jgi:hypothetical protein